MDWLNLLQKEWGDANNKAASMPKVQVLPDGNHRALILEAFPDPDRPQLRFVLQFIDNENITRTKVIFVNNDLSYVVRELKAIGVDTSDLSKLPEELAATVGKIVMVGVRSQPGSKYQRMYLNSDTGERGEVENQGSDDSDIGEFPSDWD